MSEPGIPEDRAGAYWPEPWSSEDNGSQRWCCATPQGGPGIGPGDRLELLAARDSYATDMLIRRGPGELYALRHGMPLRGGAQAAPVKGWVEKLDPETLEVLASTPRLPGGPYWPGGIAFHANGDLYMVFGCWAHRITPGLEVVASRRLPADRPHNSFVILDGGEIVTKDCDAPAGLAPSLVNVLDPETLESLAPPLGLPEPSIGRLCSDGEAVIAIGTTRVFRLTFDREAGELVIDPGWQPVYGPRPGASYGWDPVISAEHVIWMDNGRNETDTTMLGSGEAPAPLRLWWARRDDASAISSVEISGLPHGTESNPPAWDPVAGVVVAYDAGNAVLRAWRLEGDEMVPLWRRDGFAHAAHLVLYPDSRELVVQDWRQPEFLRRPALRRLLRPVLQVLGHFATVRRLGRAMGSDQLVVVDLDSGADRARVDIPSPTQAYLFPAPGFGRDIYYQSMTTIARAGVA